MYDTRDLRVVGSCGSSSSIGPRLVKEQKKMTDARVSRRYRIASRVAIMFAFPSHLFLEINSLKSKSMSINFWQNNI